MTEIKQYCIQCNIRKLNERWGNFTEFPETCNMLYVGTKYIPFVLQETGTSTVWLAMNRQKFLLNLAFPWFGDISMVWHKDSRDSKVAHSHMLASAALLKAVCFISVSSTSNPLVGFFLGYSLFCIKKTAQ